MHTVYFNIYIFEFCLPEIPGKYPLFIYISAANAVHAPNATFAAVAVDAIPSPHRRRRSPGIFSPPERSAPRKQVRFGSPH